MGTPNIAAMINSIIYSPPKIKYETIVNYTKTLIAKQTIL